MARITLSGVSYSYGKKTPYEIKALDGVNIEIADGKITGIIGHTGSGKSTLVGAIGGLIEPDEGQVLIDGADVWKNRKKIREHRFRVGLVMQYPEYQLFEETIRRDIAFGPRNMGLSDEEIEERVVEAARFVELPEALLEKSPFELSGGEKRRAAIAGVIAMRPDVLVLDEPAAGLDPRGRAAIFRNIAEYRRATGKTVIIVSHSMEDVATYCDELVVMSGAKVIMHDTPNKVFSNPEFLVKNGLDLPQIARLNMYLREKGIDLGEGIYTVEGAFNKIMELSSKK
ncbi:MAG: energy-coupling factor transporter ATPase [Clostridia bacterium]|nr:energy-coupling factor transporter ATPase [Clostridia bacterium]